MGKEGQFLLFVNKDEQAGYDARHLPASQHRAGPDPTQAVGHGPSAVWTALVYALKPHSLPAPWRDDSGAAAAGPRSVLCFVSKGRAAQDMTLPSPQAETEPGGFFLTGSTVAVGQCGVTLGWEPILFPHENATGRPRKASSEHRAGTDAVMLSSSAARGHRSPSSQCWAGRYRSAVKHHDHKSQTNPPLHDAGSDGLTQSTEGSLLFYGWDISHNAAALGVRAGGDIGFPQSKLQVVLTAQGGEEQKESGRAAARLLPNVQEELREEGKLHHRHGTIGGGVPKPGVRSFQADKPSRKCPVSVSIPPAGGRGGGRRGVELTSSPRQPGALRSALIAYGGPYGVGASLHLQHPQTTAAVGRMQAELRVLRCAARAGRGKQKAAVLRCSPPTRNHGAAEGEGREGCSTAFSPVPPSKGQKPFPKAHTHEWWFTTAAHGAAEPEEKPNAAPWDLYLGCIVCILMGASLVPSA